VKSSISSQTVLTYKNNRIHYTILSGNHVKLEIIDSRGKIVSVLVNGFKSAGDHEAALPGTLSSGMYLIRLSSGAKKIDAIQVRL